MTSGIAIRTLRMSLEIGATELARELGFVEQTVSRTEKSKKLHPATEAHYMAALATIARRQATDRRRAATEALLAIAAV